MVHKPICSWSPNDKVTHGVEAARGLRIVMLPARRITDGRPSYLLPCKAVQNIWDDRNKYETMMSLFAGSHVGSPNAYPPPLHVDNPPLEHPTRPVVDIDIEYVHGVVGANSFSYCEAQGAMGLYGLPSLLNHSCLPSAHRTFVCDAIVVRACRDMKKGEEVTVPYIAPSVPYDERRLRLMRSWKFKCTCELCEADSKDDIKAREKRRTIMKTLGQTMHTLQPNLRQAAAQTPGRGVDEALRRYEENVQQCAHRLDGRLHGQIRAFGRVSSLLVRGRTTWASRRGSQCFLNNRWG